MTTFLCNTCLAETQVPGRHCTGTAVADHAAARVTAARRSAAAAPSVTAQYFVPGTTRYDVRKGDTLVTTWGQHVVFTGQITRDDDVAMVTVTQSFRGDTLTLPARVLGVTVQW